MRQLPEIPEVVSQQRENYAEIVAHDGTLVFVGGCALTEQRQIIEREGMVIADLQNMHEDLATGQRLNPRKPRSNPEAWKGLETTNPVLAETMISSQAMTHGSVALEVMQPEHTRWIDLASFVWTGARNEDEGLITTLAMHDIRVLFGLKNALDGTYHAALERKKRIDEARAERA
jgi:3-deoxy-D-arabino-heptulosonate 7-phosphate (DAHP) synthase